MKKVTLTVKREQTFEIQFDEKKIDGAFLRAWEDGINRELFCEPYEILYAREDFSKSDFPYINLAKSIAYQIAEYDANHLEGLQFQNMTPNEFVSRKKDNDIPVQYIQRGYMDVDFELDFDNTEL